MKAHRSPANDGKELENLRRHNYGAEHGCSTWVPVLAALQVCGMFMLASVDLLDLTCSLPTVAKHLPWPRLPRRLTSNASQLS